MNGKFKNPEVAQSTSLDVSLGLQQIYPLQTKPKKKSHKCSLQFWIVVHSRCIQVDKQKQLSHPGCPCCMLLSQQSRSQIVFSFAVFALFYSIMAPVFKRMMLQSYYGMLQLCLLLVIVRLLLCFLACVGKNIVYTRLGIFCASRHPLGLRICS